MSSLAFLAIAMALSAIGIAFVLPSLLKGVAGRRRAMTWLIAAAVPVVAGALYAFVGAPQSLDPGPSLAPDLAPTAAADYV
ncbi:MAG TPA: hypothetical protein PKV98_09175, partial [Burkholderiaceae bacterium]|nr:hypothetical protein [Burkholderiaceae bacterium]